MMFVFDFIFRVLKIGVFQLLTANVSALCSWGIKAVLARNKKINKITNDDIKKQMFGDAFQARTKAE